MVSFLANPERSATAPDGTAWHIRLVRGNAWPGWSWTRRTENWNLFGSGNDGDLLIVVISALGVLAEGPPTLWRWCVYRFQRRHDWRVLVWRGPGPWTRDGRLQANGAPTRRRRPRKPQNF